MSDPVNPRQADFEEASSRLNEGLESCRSVLRNYRAMLANQDNAPPALHAAPDNDAGDVDD